MRHLLITTVRGAFDDVTGTVLYEPGQLESAVVSVDISAASINTRQAQRDEHLRSAEFFDVASHPTITFRSRSCTGSELLGELSIRGMRREVRLALQEISDEQRDHRGMSRIGASASVRLKRSDFGMTYNRALEAGGLAIADEVLVTLDLSLLKAG